MANKNSLLKKNETALENKYAQASSFCVVLVGRLSVITDRHYVIYGTGNVCFENHSLSCQT
jgi:hypothetical protein